ncbi:MAG: hypothetical protein U0457_20145 [Candidatus Sericytochromatia bacterium]
MENKFKFKKGDLEIELSGEREFVENQILDWKNYFINEFKNNSSLSVNNDLKNLDIFNNSLSLTDLAEQVSEIEEKPLEVTENNDNNQLDISNNDTESSFLQTLGFELNNQFSKPLENTTEKTLDSDEHNIESTEFLPKVISVSKKISFDDFIKLKNPSTDNDKLIVASYYLEKYERYVSFTEIDLYRIANLDNITQLINNNLIHGYIAKVQDCKTPECYTLTYSGEIYVKEGL